MKQTNKFLIVQMLFLASFLLVISILVSTSCRKKEKDDYKSSGFNSPSEMQNNPNVQQAINSSGITIYSGNTPPTIEGEYETDGVYTNASYNLNFSIGSLVKSNFKLFDQTSSNTIKFSELGSAGYSYGQGGFLTGYSNYFTIWLESNNDDGSTTILIFSGMKLSNGDLDCEGITVYVDNPPSNIELGDWFMWEAMFYKDGGGGTTGGSGYNCVSGNCIYVSNNAQYSTLATCQSVCGGSGSGVNVTFNNKVFTDITITLNGVTKTISPQGSVTYYGITGSSASYTASTSGKTSTGTQIGLLITWNNSITLSGSNVSRDLIISNDKFFLYMKNNGTKNLNKIYVNYGLNSQTLDNVVIPNDNVKYRLGYYYAWTNSNVRAYKEGTSTYLQWNQGTHFNFPWTNNQSVELYNSSKSQYNQDNEYKDFVNINAETLIPAEPNNKSQSLSNINIEGIQN
jgi:hypothetical protein